MGWMFRRMVVAGVGLIGGSLALAARRRKLVGEIIGYGRDEKNLRWAERRGIIDDYFLDGRRPPAGMDLLIMATPVQAVFPVVRSFFPAIEPGCVVSDVGSVKAQVVREMEKILPPGIPFVGAHPIAGNEQWGAQAAIADLFAGKLCLLTPTPKTDQRALGKMRSFWRRVGARVEIMDPDLHDRILAMVSHLPHVAVYALVNTLGRWDVDGVDPKGYCAGGFKDFTRIASSRPEIWRDICLANGPAIDRSLGAYLKSLERMRRWIRKGRGQLLEREFARANEIRRRIA